MRNVQILCLLDWAVNFGSSKICLKKFNFFDNFIARFLGVGDDYFAFGSVSELIFRPKTNDGEVTSGGEWTNKKFKGFASTYDTIIPHTKATINNENEEEIFAEA